MNQKHLQTVLESLKNNEISIIDVIEKLKGISPTAFSQMDIDRQFRTGAPECIYGETKTAEQITTSIEALRTHNQPILVTRVQQDKADMVCQELTYIQYDPQGRCLWWTPKTDPKTTGAVAIICAGTSDLAVAKECEITLRTMHHQPAIYIDIGVAGLHRLLQQLENIRQHQVLIVIAGMEGALPSVLSGLVKAPVIGVPTSVGYGSHLGGAVPMLSMLNSCASGISVVNIDNGYGAAIVAGRILETK